MCAGHTGLTGSLRDLLISVRGENAASDFDEVSVFTENLAVSGDIGRRLLKREVECEEAEGSCLFTVTQTVCLSASWRGGPLRMELFILCTPNFHSWQSLSKNSAQCGESLLRSVDDGNQLNSDPDSSLPFPTHQIVSTEHHHRYLRPLRVRGRLRFFHTSACGLVNMLLRFGEVS